MDDTLAVREATTAGGPIDVRWVIVDVRALEAPAVADAEGTLAFEGVPVREAEALDVALSCFVGDFTGDLTKLVRRTLGTGLGLGAFKLLLFASATSPLGADLTAAGAKLFGRAGFRAGFVLGACAMMVAIMGLTNMPYPMGQSKYLTPWTLPSFLPVFSSSSTPIHSPT